MRGYAWKHLQVVKEESRIVMEQKSHVWYKRLITGFLVFALCISFGIGEIQTNAAGNVKLNKTKVSLKVGKTVKLKICGTNKKVRWTSKKKSSEPEPSRKIYTFRSESLLEEHYRKHGVQMGFATKEDYVAAANVVIHSPDALHKLEAEDGDDVYYLEATNEFVIVSTDGYIRTCFCPYGGKDYFDRQ